MKFAILMFLALSTRLARAESFTADIYDENKKALLYHFVLTETSQGKNMHRDMVYTDPSGKVAFTETLDEEDGKLKSYSYDQPDAHLAAKVTTSGKKLLFSYTEKGKTSTDDDDFKDNTVVPATTTDYAQNHWDTLARGDTVGVRVAAMERKETVGFDLTRTGEGKLDGKDTLEIKMKPTSFIIAAIVKPMRFVFDKTTHRTLEYRGRLLPKKMDGDKLRDQDGVFVYHYN